MIEILISDFLKDSFLFDIPKFCIDKKIWPTPAALTNPNHVFAAPKPQYIIDTDEIVSVVHNNGQRLS
ncbi:MAG: hypothetical protein AB2689_04330 [Candidatus Thiodiazotropha taylori]